MDRIRLIASDMDATLLDEYSQLPPKFTETIRALAGQGILFAAASGRPLYTLETMFPDLLEEIILIGDNGGAARWKGKDLFVSEMPAEGWRQLARSTKQAGDVGLLCGLQAAYAEKQDEKYDKVFKNFYTRVEYVRRRISLPSICPTTTRRKPSTGSTAHSTQEMAVHSRWQWQAETGWT